MISRVIMRTLSVKVLYIEFLISCPNVIFLNVIPFAANGTITKFLFILIKLVALSNNNLKMPNLKKVINHINLYPQVRNLTHFILLLYQRAVLAQ